MTIYLSNEISGNSEAIENIAEISFMPSSNEFLLSDGSVLQLTSTKMLTFDRKHFYDLMVIS